MAGGEGGEEGKEREGMGVGVLPGSRLPFLCFFSLPLPICPHTASPHSFWTLLQGGVELRRGCWDVGRGNGGLEAEGRSAHIELMRKGGSGE